ncbi:hypothetical protein [Streptomyces meridianus]|uniref:Lipoprotein n=1 Tax=Streptomyces meridianus TaxID=2938945 RepID=A0ABT0X6E2_9ACTN|nr:hypothetical protein [Streptomyces meridianus]MCM2577890.1 hypothetical protein [Streptomyces meridianus]
MTAGRYGPGPEPRRVRRFRRPARTWAGLLLACAVAAGAGGCGIRGTSVPVDAGAAPVRVSCDAPADRSTQRPHSVRIVRVDAFLVCSAQLRPVHRAVPAVPDPAGAGRLRLARSLLDQLQAHPASREAAAGFGTEVPDDLTVRGARPGDPAGALRLSRPPGELPSYALAQLVCTFAAPQAGGNGQFVVLGGPGKSPVERYVCDGRLRANPESAADRGVPVT